MPSRTNPDVTLLVTMALLGAALAGPPPFEVFDPVPSADFADALVAGRGGQRHRLRHRERRP